VSGRKRQNFCARSPRTDPRFDRHSIRFIQNFARLRKTVDMAFTCSRAAATLPCCPRAEFRSLFERVGGKNHDFEHNAHATTNSDRPELADPSNIGAGMTLRATNRRRRLAGSCLSWGGSRVTIRWPSRINWRSLRAWGNCLVAKNNSTTWLISRCGSPKGGFTDPPGVWKVTSKV
jgi:hypothetical protein